jgi:hypothetical protein
MKKLLVIALSILAINGYTQQPKMQVKLVDGDLEFLKGEKAIHLQFVYTNMLIGDDGINEADYIKRKVSEYNAKVPRSGEEWRSAWFSDRKDRFEPRFIEMFEKYSSLSTKDEAKYTLIFETTRTEPGYNVGVQSASARIDADVYIVETSDPTNVFAQISVTNVPGIESIGFGYHAGYRIQEAYGRSAVEIGRLIKKKIK